MEAATTRAEREHSATGPAQRPAPVRTNALLRIAKDVRDEVTAGGPFPPGLSDFDMGRTLRMARDPLPTLLRCYEEFGPVFSLRVLHGRIVWALGPEANHQILVSNASNFMR